MNLRLLTLALGTFAIGTDSFVMAGILREIAQDFGVGIDAAGQMITAYALSYAIMTPVMAAWTSHWPRRFVLGGGLLVFSLGNALTALAASFEMGLAGRILAGAGGALYTPAASAAAAALVAPEQRGRALAVVMAGLSGATALGAPIGTLVSGLGDWRMTMWWVTGLGLLAGTGIALALPRLAGTAKLTLGERLAPLLDPRVAWTLGTTLLVLAGLYTVYSYASVAFERATDGRSDILAMLIAIWGVAATLGNLVAGALTDRFGSRWIINMAIIAVGIDFALMPLSSAALPTSIAALVAWGLCGWGLIVPQQHRLIGIAPTRAPILIALNASTIYLAVAASGVLGAAMIRIVTPYGLGLVGAVLIFLGLVTAEVAHRKIEKPGHGVSDRPGQASSYHH